MITVVRYRIANYHVVYYSDWQSEIGATAAPNRYAGSDPVERPGAPSPGRTIPRRQPSHCAAWFESSAKIAAAFPFRYLQTMQEPYSFWNPKFLLFSPLNRKNPALLAELHRRKVTRAYPEAHAWEFRRRPLAYRYLPAHEDTGIAPPSNRRDATDRSPGSAPSMNSSTGGPPDRP